MRSPLAAAALFVLTAWAAWIGHGMATLSGAVRQTARAAVTVAAPDVRGAAVTDLDIAHGGWSAVVDTEAGGHLVTGRYSMFGWGVPAPVPIGG
ncbi:hypothetical protein [Roseospira navarrensis]|uniref:Uncharacterized protein n=1 Tax=Roseospira navarrensis TaxID=140058 RepID=A0A7X2D397_9PROT|nr:hypothetical protein [Roseospira navarrensis]MQX36561.1 hypothetical protein [Roseospira navarrensis]